MKKHVLQSFFGKAVVSVLAIVMMVSVVCLFDAEVAYAADDYYFTESQTGLEITDNMTAPKPTTEGKETYIFAGYYAEETCETPVTASTDATVYKKFVPADLMSVKAQVTPGTEKDSVKTDMRLVTTVDGLNYKEVGFDVYFNGATTPVNAKTSTVYKRILATESGNSFGYSPTAFSDDAQYFTTVNLMNIANKNFDKTFFIKPYWKTLDGTKVYGMSRMARVSDSYNGIVNIPVRLYANGTVDAGSLALAYDTDILTYVNYDNGDLFDSVTVANDAENKNVTVTTPAELADPNGMVANIRFKVNEGQSMPSNVTFAVSGAFGTAIASVEYKTFSVTYQGVADTSWYDEFKDGNEFVISTPADLYGLAEIVNAGTDTFWQDTIYVAADIVINKGQASKNGWDTTKDASGNTITNGTSVEWIPIGFKNGFKGTFDGLGNTISGIYLNETEDDTNQYYGLFGYAHPDCTIRNFRIENSYFRRVRATATNQALLGSVAGQMSGDMKDVYSNAIVVTQNPAVGGLAGRLQPGGKAETYTEYVSIMQGCWFDGEIHLTSTSSMSIRAGGLGGYAFNHGVVNISDCLNTGSITYTYDTLSTKLVQVGGLIGYIDNNKTFQVNVSNCLNTGVLTVQKKTVGDNDSVTYSAHASGGVAGFFVNGNYGSEGLGLYKDANNGDKETVAGGTANVVVTDSITTYTSYNVAYQRGSKTSNVDYDSDGTKNTIYPMATFTNCVSAGKTNTKDVFSGVDAWTSAARLGIYTNDKKDATKYWVVKEDGLVGLKTFTDEWIDFGWYYNNKTDKADTFVIETAEELYAFSHVSQTDTFSKDTVELGAKIKMNLGSASSWAAGTTTPGRQFLPIGKGVPTATARAFAGTFDGKGYEVSGIYINETSGASNGFFGQITAASTVKNFKLTNSYIVNNTDTHNTGAIVGNLRGGSVSNVYADAIVKTTTAKMATGGIVGIASNASANSIISKCWFEGEVHTNGQYAGGIVGRVLEGTYTIEDCLNTGDINSTREAATAEAGGIVGAINNTKTTIKNCLNTGDVTATAETNVGSIVGQITEPVVFENVYTTVNVGDTIVGIGNTTLSTTINGEPILIEDLSGEKGYTYTDFDFAKTWVAVEGSTPVIKSLYNGKVMTNLSAQRVSTNWYYNAANYNKSLTNSAKTFAIQDVEDLYGLALIVNAGHTFKNQTVELVKNGNFDLNPGMTVTVNKSTGAVSKTGDANKWTPIGLSDAICFDGTFEGNGNTIKGLYVEGAGARQGLFGTVGSNSTVRDFTIENSYLKSSGSYVATVAACFSGNLDTVYVKDNVGIVSTYATNTTVTVGGVVGLYTGTGTKTISNCWFDGVATGAKRCVGGIVGQIYRGNKTINNCLVTGNIFGANSSTMFLGGIAGAIMGSTTDSPTVHITNSVVTGGVNSKSVNASGSIVGRSITASNGSNTVRVKVYNENVYTTDNLVVPSGTSGGFHVNGFGDMSYQYGFIYGEPMIVTDAELVGVEGYANTKLSYKTAAEDGAWVATENGPRLASFAEADVTDFANTQRESISFMYNSLVYNEQKKANKTDKAADQQSTTYMIEDVNDMYGFASVINELKTINGETELYAGKSVKLANDIVFNNVTTGKEAAGWADGSITAPTISWVPIGTVNGNDTVNAFQGTFDGDSHSIKGLYVAGEEQYLGLFRKLKDATISNLKIENSYFNHTATNGDSYIGSVSGGGDGTFDSVYSDAIVHGRRVVGGMIGRVSDSSNDDTDMILKNCQFNGAVDVDYTGTQQLYCGGLVGFVIHGSTWIDTCLYTGHISLEVDFNESGRSGWGARIGGLCGGDNGTTAGYVQVINCISAGSLNSKVLSTSLSPKVNVSQMNHVIGNTRHASSWAKNTYVIANNTKTIESTGETTESTEVFSRGSDSLAANYDVNSSFEKDTLYGYGAQMWTELSFTAEDRLAADGIELEEGQVASEVAGPIWAAIAGELPVPATLAGDRALPMTVGKPDTDLAGSGTQANPWKITSVEELAGFAELSKTKTYAGEYVVLANDIIINSGEDAAKWVDDTAEPTLPWNTSIGAHITTSSIDGKRFEGTFDGQGHTISGICYENASKGATEYVGLFATTEVGSIVKNLRLKNSYFEQVGSGYTGSVISDCRGTVSNVYSDAIVKTGSDQAGGIVGRVNGYDYVSHNAGNESRISETINNCWYDGDIILTGEARYGGGIIGIFVQGEWTLNNCVFTGTITQEYNGTSHAYVGGICGALNTPGSTKTSTMESTLNLNSCISAGTIKTSNNGLGAGAIVGRLKANVEFDEVKEEDVVISKTYKRLEASNLVMNNVFATREAGHQEVGSYGEVVETDLAGTEFTANPTITGTAVWTNNADRLVGYCTEEVKENYYTGGSLDFNTFVIREEGVPVPNNFTDLDNVTPITNVDTILALTSMDSTWTTKNAVNYGLGHYVLTATGKTYDNYTAYLAALEAQGFTPYTTLDETGTDGVYNVIYTRAAGEWVLNVLFVQNTGKVTLTISNGLNSLSPDLEPEEKTTSGDVTLSMIQLEGSKCDFSDLENLLYDDYFYGNSFVFKLPNGHFVINDGGNKADMAGLMRYLKKEAGIAEDDTISKIYIDAWTITHQHGDHLGIMREFISTPSYAEQLVVNAIYLNEPNQKAMLCYPSDTNVMNTVKTQYRGMRMLKDANGNMPKVYWCQTGQTYYFDGLTMDILQSQEQIPVNSYGKRNVGGADGTDYNTVSTNMLFTTANGKKVLITGDSNYVNMKWIMDAYGSSSQTLAGLNVYQVLHHGKNTSYNIASKDNTFTDYLLGMTTSGTMDITLFPCSVIYEYEGNHESYVFPASGAANEYLIGKSTAYYDYGDGTIKVTLGDTITSGLDTSVDTGTDNPEIEEGETGEQ